MIDFREEETASMDKTTAEARDQLVVDMKAVIADAEELLKATAGAAGERVGAARARVEETLRNARAKLSELDDTVIAQAKDAARTTDEYVHEHPWSAVGIAAVAGLLVGVMISRR
jgi:ElaB/YqjD/DUF883 family membrane-anchored ribosome-binding protein